MEELESSVGICESCKASKPAFGLVLRELWRPAVADVISREHPEWTPDAKICLNCLHRYRIKAIEKALQDERGELSVIEKDVLSRLQSQDLLSASLNYNLDNKLSLGQKVADKVAEFGGSWSFIGCCGVLLGIWILFNIVSSDANHFDPYPFILLNLILSCLAAMQAPIIMMSQNRQEAKDRKRAEMDYGVNLKAEVEVRQLHLKLDQLMSHQWQRLLEIQQLQIDMLGEISEKGQEARLVPGS